MTRKLLRSVDLSKLPCDVLISTPLRLRFAISQKKKAPIKQVRGVNIVFMQSHSC